MRKAANRIQLTATNIDIWLQDEELTPLRRAELEAARDRVAAIKTAAIMNGIVDKGDDDGGRDTRKRGREAGTKADEAISRSRNTRNNMG